MTDEFDDQQYLRLRRCETRLAYATLTALLLYLPAETIYSWPDLFQPGYIVDFLAFVLLGFGGWFSLSARPQCGVAPLCAAWGYCAALGWRSYFERWYGRKMELPIYVNEPGWVSDAIGVATILAFLALGYSLWLAVRYQKVGRRIC